MKIVVLNASQNVNGNSTNLARRFLAGLKYQQVNLVDYRIDQIGQVDASDQLNVVMNKIEGSDALVITTPVYWSAMPGYLKTFIDRSGDPSSNRFQGMKCFLLIQSMAPEDAIKPISHVVEHWSTRDSMNFVGEATNDQDIKNLRTKLEEE